MNVLQVTPRYPPRVGGVEAHVSALAAHLRDRGHEVTVVATDRREDEPGRERRDGVEVRRLRALAPNESFHLAPALATTVRRLAREADVVHAHNYHSLPLTVAAFAVGDTPFVATPHYHGTGSTDLSDLFLRAFRPVGRRGLARADARICVSEWERMRVRGDFDLDADLIPNGLDVDRFATATPADRKRPYVFCVGRLTAYKGVEHVVRAMTRLPEFDLLVAGDGEDRDRLERVAEDAGVADRVTFLGYVADEDLPGLYAGAAAYASLSTVEAYGMTVAEALAAGTPCVVREAGALVEWAERDDCVGVADDSPASVAAAVREAMTRSAPSDSLPDWESIVDRLLAVYERVCR